MQHIEILNNLKTAIAIRFGDQRGYRKKISDILGISISVVSRKMSGETLFQWKRSLFYVKN